FGGYNFGGGDALVLGVEGDLALGNFAVSLTGAIDGEVQYLATLRGRIGWAFGPALAFATAGIAFAGTEATEAATIATATHFGWALGAGLDLSLGGNFFVRGEYQYVALGSQDYTLPSGTY